MKSGISWSATIALSWLWGLGFFYSIHITYNYGWLGFLSFAIPNALGLASFGVVTSYFLKTRSFESILSILTNNFSRIILAYQALAIAITLFGFYFCLFSDVFGGFAIPFTAMLVVLSIITANLSNLSQIKLLHIAYLLVGLLFALITVGKVHGVSHSSQPLNGGFWGVIVPMLVGFSLGPWLDIQQWQRAFEIHKKNQSVSNAYIGGGILFFCLIAFNALIVQKSGIHSDALLNVNFAGASDATRALTLGLPVNFLGLFTVWASLAFISTLDSGYKSLEWFLSLPGKRSNHPLMALIPSEWIKSPNWIFITSIVIAVLSVHFNLGLLDLMAPFGTFFCGYSLCLLFCLWQGVRYQGSQALQFGALSLVIFGIGFYSHVVSMQTVAPLIALLCALPVFRVKTENIKSTVQQDIQPIMPLNRAQQEVLIGENTITMVKANGYFDGEWYNYEYIPTYDDTNSVGNVYWANYLRWVGKTRELFFSLCMPDFDLKTTSFLILTNEITHKFRDEAKEFEKVLIRIRIGEYNRKFAVLEHEIRKIGGDGEMAGMVGKGHQKLMFVHSTKYSLLDIPAQVLTSFLPYIKHSSDKG